MYGTPPALNRKTADDRSGRDCAGQVSAAVSYTHLDVYKRQVEGRAMVTLLQIGGLINLEERSGSFLPELPYTNRGVIRQKEELSALIDWCQITIKEVPLEAVIEDVLRIPLELMTVTGYEKGIAGHEVVAIFDNIKVLRCV